MCVRLVVETDRGRCTVACSCVRTLMPHVHCRDNASSLPRTRFLLWPHRPIIHMFVHFSNVDSAEHDSGSYHLHVVNRDAEGSACSRDARLKESRWNESFESRCNGSAREFSRLVVAGRYASRRHRHRLHRRRTSTLIPERTCGPAKRTLRYPIHMTRSH